MSDDVAICTPLHSLKRISSTTRKINCDPPQKERSELRKLRKLENTRNVHLQVRFSEWSRPQFSYAGCVSINLVWDDTYAPNFPRVAEFDTTGIPSFALEISLLLLVAILMEFPPKKTLRHLWIALGFIGILRSLPRM